MADEFLRVVDAEEARRLFGAAVKPSPLGEETIPLPEALGRVLAQDISSPVDVPGFDRANVDGYAVCAESTFGATEADPARLRLNTEEIAAGMVPRTEVTAGTATRIATGGMLPRGADAVVMVEYTEREGDHVVVMKPATPGTQVSFAGSDIARGELTLGRGTRLTARETGTLAALGVATVAVFLRPRVAVFSTGNEIIRPGEPVRPGLVYDSNLTILCDSLREIGCEPIDLGVVEDNPDAIQAKIEVGLDHDAVIFSGGTSKGEGDHGPAVVRRIGRIVCHGVAIKPGKPLCLAVRESKPIVILPGFPTSAVFTFHAFVAPILIRLAGAPADVTGSVRARMPLRIPKESGRAEFLLVTLLDGPRGPVAYPMGKGSGSVTSFSRADGFVTLDRQQEYVEADEIVDVRLLGRDLRPADLVVIGSHCVGLDFLLSLLRRDGFTTKSLTVGSQGGFLAAERGECDLAGVHLCDDASVYNTPFLKEGMVLLTGYRRMQGIVYRGEEPPPQTARMVNRNRGSGTRVLIDALLGDARPPGYTAETRSHNAVAAAVAQGRADWGVCIQSVARMYGLEFRPLREEHYDFVLPSEREQRPAIQAFRRLLNSPEARTGLTALGFHTEVKKP